MTLEELISEIENLFDCTEGLHWAYAVTSEEGAPDEKYRYHTVSYITAKGAEHLRKRLLADLQLLHASTLQSKPILYWRFAVECRIDEDSDFRTRRVKIYTRVAIPDADWSVLPLKHIEGQQIPVI